MIPRLKEKYKKEIVPKLMKDLSYSNLMQVPRIKKICLSQGVGSAVSDKKMIDSASEEMTKIAGQKSMITKSKKDISYGDTDRGWRGDVPRFSFDTSYLKSFGVPDFPSSREAVERAAIEIFKTLN